MASARRSGDLALRRIAAQRVSATTFTRPEQVVAWLGAVQAQDYLGALWAVGLRLKGARELDIERALAERRIVRTWPMRGTLHFVTSEDARWITDLCAPRPAAKAASRMKSYDIDGKLLIRARRVLERALGNGPLARPAVYRALDDAGISTARQRGLHILWRLAHDTAICFGPREGKQHTFALFDAWIPHAKPLPRDESLARLAERYIASHGPATAHDFAWWSGLTVSEARRGLAAAGTHEAPATARGGAHVLPAFDELIVGYADRSAFVSAPVPVMDLLGPVVVVDGRVVATWKRSLDKREVTCTIAAVAPVDRARVTAACERYARFLGLRSSGPVFRP
jgi:hypothetical protein